SGGLDVTGAQRLQQPFVRGDRIRPPAAIVRVEVHGRVPGRVVEEPRELARTRRAVQGAVELEFEVLDARAVTDPYGLGETRGQLVELGEGLGRHQGRGALHESLG